MRSASTERRVKGVSAFPVSLEVDYGTAYELVLGLRMVVDRDEDESSYSLGPAWFERTRARLPAAVLRAVLPVAAPHHRHPTPPIRRGLRGRLELHVVRPVQPCGEDLLA